MRILDIELLLSQSAYKSEFKNFDPNMKIRNNTKCFQLVFPKKVLYQE